MVIFCKSVPITEGLHNSGCTTALAPALYCYELSLLLHALFVLLAFGWFLELENLSANLLAQAEKYAVAARSRLSKITFWKNFFGIDKACWRYTLLGDLLKQTNQSEHLRICIVPLVFSIKSPLTTGFYFSRTARLPGKLLLFSNVISPLCLDGCKWN